MSSKSASYLLASKQENFTWEVTHTFVQNEGNKIVVVDVGGESAVGCGWSDVIGERVPLLKKNLVLSIEQKNI